MLRRTLHAFERRVIYPWAAWRGWRPSCLRSVALRDLEWDFGFEDEEAIKRAVRLVAAHTVVSLERLASLWWQIRQLDQQQIPGALVECGVRLGGSSAMMALAHMASVPEPYRSLDLFDSFKGMPDPTEQDGEQVARLALQWAAENLNYPPEVSRRLIVDTAGYPGNLVRYHVGWFQDTAQADAPTLGPIALLRLDGDFYESTKVCLEAFYPNVSVGGIVVIDDYGPFNGCRTAVDEFTARFPRPFFLHRIDVDGRYWIKARE